MELLQIARKARGWSQAELAERVGVTTLTVGRWERGDAFPSDRNVEVLCRVLGKDARALGLSQHAEVPLKEPSPPLVTTAQKEHPSTYLVQDRDNLSEMERLELQDDLLTRKMGGVLPEQEDLTRFQHILDVGCGTGGWLMEVAQTYPDIPLLVGVDISGSMLAYARAKANALGLSDRVQFQSMDALRLLEFPDEYFDLVNQRLGMSYLRTWDWPTLLQQYKRVTRRSGIVRVTEATLVYRSSSPALMMMTGFFTKALYQAGHFFAIEPTGITAHMPQILGRTFLNVQKRVIPMMHIRREAEGKKFIEDMRLGYKTASPFLKKWINISSYDYETLYQEMLKEMDEEDFYALGAFETVWAKAP